MTCPQCGTSLDPQVFRIEDRIGVCPGCARSLVTDGETVRPATAEDIRALTPGQVTQLRQARPAAWRNDVRARHAQIVGGRS